MIYVSPHLDDAVLSVGETIAVDPDALVVTVLGGYPGPRPVTAYDVRCGFKDGDDAVGQRTMEDLRACAVLGAVHLSLHHLDGQYGTPIDQRQVAGELAVLAAEHEILYAPLGLAHEDHVVVSNAAIEAAKRTKCRLFLYEDLPSRVVWPEMVTDRRAALQGTFHARHPAYDGGFITDIKEAAIRCYRSQIDKAGLPWRAALVPERLWEVTW